MGEINNIKVGDTVLLVVIDSSSQVIKFIRRAGFIVQILYENPYRSASINCFYLKGKFWQFTNTTVPIIYDAPVSRMVLTEKTNKIFTLE